MCEVLSCGRPAARGRFADSLCRDCRLRLLEEVNTAGGSYDNHAPAPVNWSESGAAVVRRWKRDDWGRYYERVGA